MDLNTVLEGIMASQSRRMERTSRSLPPIPQQTIPATSRDSNSSSPQENDFVHLHSSVIVVIFQETMGKFASRRAAAVQTTPVRYTVEI